MVFDLPRGAGCGSVRLRFSFGCFSMSLLSKAHILCGVCGLLSPLSGCKFSAFWAVLELWLARDAPGLADGSAVTVAGWLPPTAAGPAQPVPIKALLTEV